MTLLTREHLDSASRLLSQAGLGKDSTLQERAAAAAKVFDTLSARLVPLIGSAGVRALFARSAKLNKAEFPTLREVFESDEQPDRTAHRLLACLTALEPNTSLEAATALYATVLALLTTFVGEALVLQILRSAFPAIELSDPKETER